MPGQGVVLRITDPSSAQLQSPARWSGKLSELCELSLEDEFFELAPRPFSPPSKRLQGTFQPLWVHWSNSLISRGRIQASLEYLPSCHPQTSGWSRSRVNHTGEQGKPVIGHMRSQPGLLCVTQEDSWVWAGEHLSLWGVEGYRVTGSPGCPDVYHSQG